MNSYPQPEGLGERAAELWDGLTSKYDLRKDELFILHEACREIDLIDRMENFQRGDELTGRGSQGQVVAAPMLAELRQHRALFAAHMKQLKLPDEDGRAAERISSDARAAANARWGRSG
jgi:hypothetical protein